MTTQVADRCQIIHQLVEEIELGKPTLDSTELETAKVALECIHAHREQICRNTGACSLDLQLTNDLKQLSLFVAQKELGVERKSQWDELQLQVESLESFFSQEGSGSEEELLLQPYYHQGVIEAAAQDYRRRNDGFEVPEQLVQAVTRGYAQLVLEQAAHTYGWDRYYVLFRKSSTIHSNERFGYYVASVSFPLHHGKVLHRLIIFDKKYKRWYQGSQKLQESVVLEKALKTPLESLASFCQGASEASKAPLGCVIKLNEEERSTYVSVCRNRYIEMNGKVVEKDCLRVLGQQPQFGVSVAFLRYEDLVEEASDQNL